MTKGHQLLRDFCARNGITSAVLARMVSAAAGKLAGVRKPKHLPYTQAKRWLSGLWRPHVDWRTAIEEATDGYVPVASWQEPA